MTEDRDVESRRKERERRRNKVKYGQKSKRRTDGTENRRERSETRNGKRKR